MNPGSPVIMLVAGEASGDDRGAGLAHALRRRLDGNLKLIGVGGPRMAEAGVPSLFDMAEISVFGLLEGLLAIPRVRRRAQEVAMAAAREGADLVVLIDSWGFSWLAARALRRLAPRVRLVKYVAPQVWATRPGRAKALAGLVDHLLVINSFEPPYFEAWGLPTTFVGNPALHMDFSACDPAGFRSRHGIGAEAPVLLVLPGSRPGEVDRLLPPFEDAIRRLKVGHPSLQVVLPVAESVADRVKAVVAGWPFRVHVVEGEDEKREALRAGDLALACSGTVTLEVAQAGVPMVVAYRLGSVTHFVARFLIRTPWVVLFNIAARDFVAPELIQDDCTGPRLAAELDRRLRDPAFRRAQVAAQDSALDQMGRGGPDPSEAAALVVLEVLSGDQPRLSSGT
ncbi:MAG: lipid-A-disaccharide synthase [Phenylobacterium sp.]|uniref:lipid-A-disaccharide synthase n=1 Tax=Phenylobacterium sp. TaxID=1871053 RepID=UPI0025D905B8|nr:lipid-A-disaccharide synthase [Phenylobacterium sp.]MCA6299220.1 lipid-A-disaccharide synthase [Phenylobacterium sp.]